MRKRPGMSLLIIAALVLGIGANSSVFAVVNTVLLRPLPLPDPDRLVMVLASSPQFPNMPASYPEFLDWKAECHSFQGMAAYRAIYVNLTGSGVPEHLKGLRVSASFFRELGVGPAVGRDFSDDDDRPGATPVVIISHGLWERKFGSDPAILGKQLVLDDRQYAVVGVAPANEFTYIRGFDVWIPTGLFLGPAMTNRNNRFDGVVARLNPDATLAQAQAEMGTIAQRMAVEFPQSNQGIGAVVLGVASLVTTQGRRPLLLLLSASGLILLLACVNVVTVFVAGAMERRKELSVRLALGADRAILLRQMFVQSALFALAGSALGLAVARLVLAMLTNRFPHVVPRFQEVSLDSTVLWFTGLTAVVVGLLCGLLPALYAFKLNINNELKGNGTWSFLRKYRTTGQTALIVFEVSLAAGLSMVSGLLIKSFYEVERVDLGFNPDRLLSFQVLLPASRYNDADKMSVFYDQAIKRIRNIPGVQSASAVSTLPLSGAYHFINLEVEGAQIEAAAQRPYVDNPSVLPGYFAAIRSPILQGRDFRETDGVNSAPVAIVDDVLAKQMWPGQNPLGKRIRLADIGDTGPPWREIIGVVHQMKHYGPEKEVPRMQVYTPLFQVPVSSVAFVVNFLADQRSIQAASQQAIYELDKDLPLDSFRTLDDLLSVFVSGRKVSVLLLGSFAGIGIALGMIGIYGVVSNSVVRMRREIAIRMALGATVRSTIVLVARVGLVGGVAGVLVGTLIVVSMTRVLSAFLFGITPLDLPTYFLTAAFTLLLASIASLVPAQSLSRLNPQDVLREQ